MKKILSLLLIVTLQSNSSFGQMNYQTFEKQFLENLWKTHPEWASSLGLHQFDTFLTIPNEMNRQKQMDFLKS